MLVSKLFCLLLLLTSFSQSYAAEPYDDDKEIKEAIEYEEAVREAYNNHRIYIDKEIEKSVNTVYDVNVLSLLMQTYFYDDSITLVNNDKLLIENLDKGINKDRINETVHHVIERYDNYKQHLLYEHPVIKGLIKHHDSLKEPISNNGAISQAVHLSSENFLDLRKTVTEYIIGFVTFCIVFHFAFRAIISLKEERNRNNKKSMFILTEIMANIILLVILSLLVNNKCRDFRINTTRLLSVAYNEALAYSYEYNEEDFQEYTDTTEVKETISDSDYRALLKNMEYRTFDVPLKGFAIQYPAIFTDIQTSHNSDGGWLKDKWGIAKLVTSGSFNICEWSIDSLARFDHQDNLHITYLKIFRNKKYYIKSGYMGKDTIFYEKGGIIINDGNETNVSARLEYPKRFRKDFEPIIKKIFNEFPILREYVIE